ncbi:MAG TPA: ferric reductase-like transmembrane domain-containing protein [Candidatus Acidoferrales bacterium]|nr:ferric reductase-like transmembrane domain-containing protein [Candidatus Acidoferrales bacterium]
MAAPQVRYFPHSPVDRLRHTGFYAATPVAAAAEREASFWSPQQPLQNTIGAAALYLLVIIVVTSIYRIQLGRHFWKLLHYLTYPAAACLFIHGILTDPNLNGQGVDYLDGGKVFVEICCVIIVVASAWRVRFSQRKRVANRLASLGQEAAAE